MAFQWNIFRILADVSHALSKCILLWAIHSNQSAEGVSLITQIQYLVVFCARYIPTVWFPEGSWHTVWNVCLKIFYITSSAYIVFIMTKVFPHTSERDTSRKIGAMSTGVCLLMAPFLMLIFIGKDSWSFAEFSWSFSIALESVCVLPQLLLLRQTTVPTVIDSFYLVTLGSYRGFYLINWLVRAVVEGRWDPISIVFGLLQTALYVDFAWVYWTRQRVKLRGGSVVDSDDLSRGWLIRRFVGARGEQDDEEGQAASNNSRTTKPSNKWGARGISVSADDNVRDELRTDGAGDDLADPERFADEEEEEERAPALTSVQPQQHEELERDETSAAVGNGSEWQDNVGGK